MSIYIKRWENAKRIAEAINNFIDKGYLVFDEYGEFISKKFIITEEDISLITSDGRFYFFRNDKDFDEGIFTPIEQYNEQFKRWTVVDPKYIQSLKDMKEVDL